jgi:hypothetical protein
MKVPTLPSYHGSYDLIKEVHVQVRFTNVFDCSKYAQ